MKLEKITNESENIKNQILESIEKIKKLNNEYSSLTNSFDQKKNKSQIEDLENQIEIFEEALINNPYDNKYFFKKLSYYQQALRVLEKNANFPMQIINKKIEINNLINKKVLFFQLSQSEKISNNLETIKEGNLATFNETIKLNQNIEKNNNSIDNLSFIVNDRFQKMDINLSNFIQNQTIVANEMKSVPDESFTNSEYNQNQQYDQNAQYNENQQYDQNAQYNENDQYNQSEYDQNQQYINNENQEYLNNENQLGLYQNNDDGSIESFLNEFWNYYWAHNQTMNYAY